MRPCSSQTSATYIYDEDGNLLSDGIRTYEWDARNQLTAINDGARRSEFTYDGEFHRVRIVEKQASTVLSDDRFLWDGNDIAERRDASGSVVTARLFQNGLQVEGAARYLSRDHLMSIREVTDSTGELQARYDYAPYGHRTTVFGSGADLLGFTGVPFHEASGLLLMNRRTYDTERAQWLSEDPVGLRAGPNVYAYVANRPLTWLDPEGTTAVLMSSLHRRDKTLQDLECSSPVTALNGNSCYTKCCQEHDRCYTTFGCTQTTWQTFLSPIDICDLCNWKVVICVLTSSVVGGCKTCSR